MKNRAYILSLAALFVTTIVFADVITSEGVGKRGVKHADGRAGRPTRVEGGAGISSNKRLIPEGGTWSIRISNSSGLNYRCNVIGYVNYKNEGAFGKSERTKGDCTLQTAKVTSRVTNSKVKIASRESLENACRVPKNGKITGAAVSRLDCSQVANEEGDDGSVATEEDANPPADEDEQNALDVESAAGLHPGDSEDVARDPSSKTFYNPKAKKKGAAKKAAAPPKKPKAPPH